jgi:hypothetical protein
VHLVQLLLPIADAEGRAFSRAHYEGLAGELSERFGGLTAYTRAPATGLWEERPGRTVRDEVVVFEVMIDAIDEAWWAGLRQRLERLFDQQELVIRAQEMRRL